MARPTDDFFELFRKKRVFSIKKVVGPKRLRTLSKNQVGQKAQITLVDSSTINLGVNSVIEEIFYGTKSL